MFSIFKYHISDERDNRIYTNFCFRDSITIPKRDGKRIFAIPLICNESHEYINELEYVHFAFLEKKNMISVMKSCPLLPTNFNNLVSKLAEAVIKFPTIDLSKTNIDTSISKYVKGKSIMTENVEVSEEFG